LSWGARSLLFLPLAVAGLAYSSRAHTADFFVSNATQLTDAVVDAASGDRIVLLNSINLGATPLPPVANDITIDSGIFALDGSAFSKTGPGTLTLIGNNSFASGTLLESGTLSIAGDNALGPNALEVIGGTLDIADGVTFGVNADNFVVLGDASNLTGTFNVNVTGLGATGTISGDIFETGGGTWGLTKTGTGELVLSGDNGFSGTTTVSQGRLTLDSNSGFNDVIGDSAAVVVNGGTLNVAGFEVIGSLAGTGGEVTIAAGESLIVGFFGGPNTTYAGTINGDGSFEKELDGTLTLTGTSSIGGDLVLCNCATGGIDINGTGSFSVGGIVEVLASVLSVSEGGQLQQTDSSSGIGIDDGTLQVSGSGSTATIAGNTFIGGFGAGTMTIGDGGVVNSNNTANIGALSLGSSVTVDGASSIWTVIDGLTIGQFGFTTGSLTIANGGHVAVTGALVDTVTVNSDSTLNLGDGGTAGTISTSQITLNGPNAQIIADFTDTLTLAATVVDGGSGMEGSLTKNGTGTLNLTSDINNWAGGTTVNDGVLQIGDGGTTGFISGNMNLAGASSVFAINRAAGSSDVELDGVISGAGGLRQDGGGTTLLSGGNSYTGATTINAGVLALKDMGSIFGSSGLTINNDGVFDISAFNVGLGPSIKTLSGGDNTSIALGANSLFVDNNAITTFAGTIEDGGLNGGTGGAIELRSGTLTLSGTNTYSGGTTIGPNFPGAATTLVATNANSVGTGTVIINSLGVFRAGADNLDFANNFRLSSVGGSAIDSNGFTLTISGVISDSSDPGRLNKNGAGTLILTANNTYGGGTVINAGTLQLGNGGATGNILSGTGEVSVGSGAVFAINRSDSLTYSGPISGLGAFTQSGTGTTTLSAVNTYGGGTSINAGALRATSTSSIGSGAVTLAGGAFQAGANNLNFTNSFLVNVVGGSVDTNGNTLTLSGTIANGNGTSGVLTKSGAGTLILSATNTYSGGTTISAGTLQAMNANAVGTGSVTLAGGTFLPGVAGPTFANAFAINTAGGSIGTNGTTLTLTGNITNGNGTNGVLTKTGTGTLVLSGNSSYSGGTAVNLGTLRVANSTAVGTGLVTLGGSTFQAGAAGLSFANAFAINTSGGTVDTNGNTLTLSGVIGNGNGATGALRKTGAGTLVLAGNNTFGGGTILQQGTLRLEHNNALGSGALTTLGSVIDYADGVTLANPIVLNSNDTQLQMTVGVATQAGVISEAGGVRPLEKIGAGTLIFTASNTYTGGTLVSGGTLQLGNGGTTGNILGGAGNVSVASGAVFAVNRSDTFIYSGTVSGLGGFAQRGTGTTTLSAVNGHSGGSSISAGTLRVTNVSSVGTGAVTLAGGGFQAGANNLIFVNPFAIDTAGGSVDSNGNTLTLSGTIANGNGATGVLTKSGTGTLVFSGNNTYAGGTTINAGILQVLNSNAVGTGRVTLAGGSFLAGAAGLNFANAFAINTVGGTVDTSGTTLTLAGSIADGNGTSGLLTKAGAGTLVLAGNNTYSGGTILQQGTLRLEHGNALGSGTLTTLGSIVDYLSGITVANPILLNADTTQLQVAAGVATQAGVISEAGGARPLEKTGAGTLIFTASNSYTGDTTVSGGTLQLGNGGTTGSIAGNVAVDGTLAFNRSSLLAIFNGVIADKLGGQGNVVHSGSGSTVLTANHTYSGTTLVNAGTLFVNGSIAASSLVTVGAGARIGGTGFLPTTIVAGTLAPGNSIGTLNVVGNLTMAAGSTYEVEVSPVAADLTNVTGTANLSGATAVALYQAGIYVARQYTILAANGGLGGTSFAGLAGAAPTGFSHSLAYDGNHAYLVLTLDMTGPGRFAGIADNQRAVATAISNFFETSGSLPPAFGALDLAGLTIASGEISTAAVSAGLLAGDLFLAQISDPFVTGARSGEDGASAPVAYAAEGAARPRANHLALAALGGVVPDAAAQAQSALAMASHHSVETAFAARWTMWGAAYGAVEQISGDPMIVGSANFTGRAWGIASGFSHTFGGGHAGLVLGGASGSFALGNALGSGSAGSFNTGIHGSHDFGDAYMLGAVAYSLHNVKTTRLAFGDMLTGRYNAHSVSGRVEAGYRLDTPFAVLTPYIAAQGTSYFLPGYTESGAGIFAISYGAQTESSARTELGARLEHLIPLDKGGVKLTGRAAWAYDAETARAVSGAFVALPGQVFTINGARPDRHSVLLDLGIEAAFENGLAAKLSFSGEFSSKAASYGASAKISYRW
jgi:fibronectin-binding autotransporter adhesin